MRNRGEAMARGRQRLRLCPRLALGVEDLQLGEGAPTAVQGLAARYVDPPVQCDGRQPAARRGQGWQGSPGIAGDIIDFDRVEVAAILAPRDGVQAPVEDRRGQVLARRGQFRATLPGITRGIVGERRLRVSPDAADDEEPIRSRSNGVGGTWRRQAGNFGPAVCCRIISPHGIRRIP